MAAVTMVLPTSKIKMNTISLFFCPWDSGLVPDVTMSDCTSEMKMFAVVLKQCLFLGTTILLQGLLGSSPTFPSWAPSWQSIALPSLT